MPVDRHSGLDLQIKYAGMVWLLVAQVMVMLPFMAYLPTWLMLVLLACTAWRLRVLRGHWAQPSWIFKGAVIVLGLAALGASGIDPLSLDTASSLLLLAFAFKSLEVIHRRDAVVVVFTGYFLVAVQFLYNQSIAAALYGLICLVFLTAALIAAQEAPDKRVGDHLKLAAVMLLQCLPLMVILYLFFPRLPPLWSVTLPTEQAVSGISDHMAPGDIARLSQSDAVAFRVNFNGDRPQQSRLYWRGLTLNYFNGHSWRQFAQDLPLAELKNILRVRLPSRQGDWTLLSYEVIYERSRQPWLFTLATVLDWEGEAFAGFDYRLMAEQPLMAPVVYRLHSDIDSPRRSPLNPALRRLTLQLPQAQNPRAHALAERLRNQVSSDQAYVNRVMQLFAEGDYLYTLRPPLGGQRDTIDNFLFESRRGFCSHYAGSFVYLMRAAGIPARVVIGYQGGEWNEGGNFLSVRQYDAHAWAEVWLEEQGWVRFDPTTMVAPERVEQNLQTAVEEEGSFLEQQPFSPLRLPWLDSLRQQWDSVQYGWRRWVLGYDGATQQAWLKQWLGEVSLGRVAIVFGVLFSLILLAWLLLLGYLRPEDRRSPAVKLYQKMCRRLEKRGLKRPLELTPGQFAVKAGRKFPQLADTIGQATELFEQLSYRELAPAEQQALLRELKLAVRKL